GHGLPVGDVDPLEGVVRPIGNHLQVPEIGRVRQCVDTDERVVREPGHEEVEKVRSDEPGTAGHDDCRHQSCLTASASCRRTAPATMSTEMRSMQFGTKSQVFL